MRMTQQQLSSLSAYFAEEAVSRLSDFSKGLKPDSSVEPVKEFWDEKGLKIIFRAMLTEALLSVVTVEPPQNSKLVVPV